MGISLAEYVRRLVVRDLAAPQRAASPAAAFDLGSSAGSDIAANKDTMIAAAFVSNRRQGEPADFWAQSDACRRAGRKQRSESGALQREMRDAR